MRNANFHWIVSQTIFLQVLIILFEMIGQIFFFVVFLKLTEIHHFYECTIMMCVVSTYEMKNAFILKKKSTYLSIIFIILKFVKDQSKILMSMFH